ncbi:diaminopropionate ammonia-lyase [Candidatus Leptofilum sp.]|uniref:diaminopropionate ammonia-lyase n=1 Tax=Candidatus Leptofilum sp. TaxID=3241576 RepID=UPI003B5A4410
MSELEPISWVANKHARQTAESTAVSQLLPPGISKATRRFHAQIPGYKITPLKSLPNLANYLGVDSIWVKDESQRMGLNAFKSLGGSFAIYQFIRKRLGVAELSYKELMSDTVRDKLGEITFTSATDGNHGKGLAWATKKLRFPCVIYVHKDTSQARVDAITEYGAEVRVVQGNYDDAVRQCNADAQANGWQVISDTSWPGYEEIPAWVMQGYTTLLAETQEQFAAQGIVKPTHVFVQAGVGAFAAATLGFYHRLFGLEAPISVVVEPATAACLYYSAQMGDGQPHTIDGDLQTIMAGLACGEPSPLAWQTLWDCADFFLTSPDYVAAKGMRIYGVPLQGDPIIISGESGAVTLGSLTFIMQHEAYRSLKQQLQLDEDSVVLFINTEGNTDPHYFRQVVWEGHHPVPDEYLV